MSLISFIGPFRNKKHLLLIKNVRSNILTAKSEKCIYNVIKTGEIRMKNLGKITTIKIGDLQ